MFRPQYQPDPRLPGIGLSFLRGEVGGHRTIGHDGGWPGFIYPGHMGRMIWTILGAILAIWLVFMAIGSIFAMLKTFVIIVLIAAAVFIVVSLLSKRRRRG